MFPLDIRDGFRCFNIHDSLSALDALRSHASIEFVRTAPLPEEQPVRVSVGVTESQVRTLVGVPRFICAIERPDGTTEYRYRLEGPLGPTS